MIRQPIVSVLGHVDHGKTTLLDKIRGTAIAQREAGGITQHIGATEIPIEVIEKICGDLIKKLKIKITLPGLLFIDTPGHEAFTTLRKRGGALADLAILVIDITEGFRPQTIEALNILRSYKTPFVVAANKIDKISGWKPKENYPFLLSFASQPEETKAKLENLVYEIVGELYNQGFQAERFDRIEKYERQVSIVPVSALTGEGIPELLMVILGLAQRFLEKQLEISETAPAKGTILEVKEERGLGTTIDVIIYDGKIKRGDLILLGSKEGVIQTKVRSLLKPKPLDEIRDPKHRFSHVSEAFAACGVKIAAPNLENALAGSPLRVIANKDEIEKVEAEIMAEIEEVKIETDKIGVVIKADTLGSLEGLIKLLENEGIPIRRADVGDVSKRDVMEAEAVREKDKSKGVILGFNVGILRDAEARARESDIPIFLGNVIYKLVEDYQEWILEEIEKKKLEEFEKLTKPGKIRILPGYVFRTSKPAIVGIEVIEGKIKPGYKLIKDGKIIGSIKGIQEKNINLTEATKNMQVAISIEDGVVGRNIEEGDILYTFITDRELELLEKEFRDKLTEEEIKLIEEIKEVQGCRRL
ncbi:MAG: translation initiation factor IF-2 [Candidatus Hydrothermarchaeota archaeon]|nr:MAG: translation initiation factor IF-2 [Candidatus Hydrothermarchaeota archaeon]